MFTMCFDIIEGEASQLKDAQALIIYLLKLYIT